MTFRKRLICGLLLAAPVAVPTATWAGEEAPAAVSAPPIIPFAPSDTSLSAWKKSDQPTSAEIRFKKPEPIIFTDQAPASKDKSKASAVAPAALAANRPAGALLAPIAAPAGLVIAAPPAATTAENASPTPASAPASNKAASTTLADASANTQTATEPPAAQAEIAAAAATVIAAAPPAPVAAAQPQSNTTPSSTPIRDDQIELVAQLLMDRGVIRAAQEEPLPSSPDAVQPTTNGMNGTGTNGGDGEYLNGGECCPDACCQPRLMWVGGVEATFLVPDLNRDGVSFQTERIDDEGTQTFLAESEDTDSMYVSPRVWLGVQGCCWGANLRYWHLQASEGSYDPSIGSLGTWDGYDCGKPDVGFFDCSTLEAYTVDLELTRRFCLHDCWMQASVGVRHAELWADDGITGLALTDEGLLNGFGRANFNSRGTGILLGLYGRKPIFPCSCVNWFYNARWSALWGSTQTSAETFAAVQSTDPDFLASAASVNGAYTTIDDTMFIGEIQLGLEWDYCLCCMPANAFFRMAIEYQRWDGGQGFSAADSFAGITIVDEVDPTSVVSTTASADEPQMDLFGFSIGTGLTW